MSDHTVLLVSMPWDELAYPSIQLGILRAVLDRAGIRAEVRSVKLDFVEHCIAATAEDPPEARLGVAEYDAVVDWSRDVNLGDWIFSVPPFREASAALDAGYLALLRARQVPQRVIGAALRFRAEVLAFLDRCADEILATSPAVVGFTTGFNQTVASLVLAKLLKARVPGIRVVFGGANCQGPMGEALHRAFPWVDVVVRGEGEAVLPGLVDDLLTGGSIRPQAGLCYRDGDRTVAVPEQPGTVRMDDVPLPGYDEYFERLEKASVRRALSPKVTLYYESARGCWWGAKAHCTFCGISDLVMPFRSRSPERVVEEVCTLARRYGTLNFLVVDYILDRRYFREVLPRLRDLGLDLRLFCETKANLTKADVRLLGEAGFVAVQAGVESLSDPILRLVRKGVTAFQNIRLLKWCAELGVHLYWNVIYGLPGEPPEEYARMADVMRSLVHLEPPRLVPLALDRFSPYHERPEAFGLVPLGPRRDYRFIYPVADEATLTDLAYTFEYRHADGRDPAAYVGPLRDVVETWHARREDGFASLRYRLGPGFLVVSDQRPGLEPAEYRFEEREAAIYRACEDGATSEEVRRALEADGITDVSLDGIRDFLDELAAARLVHADRGRYLALALPAGTVRREARPFAA